MPSTPQIILFSQPRTACHLLERMLISKQVGVKHLHHPARAAVQIQSKWHLSDGWTSGVTDDQRLEYEEANQHGIETWQQALDESRDNVYAFLRSEHCFASAEHC